MVVGAMFEGRPSDAGGFHCHAVAAVLVGGAMSGSVAVAAPQLMSALGVGVIVCGGRAALSVCECTHADGWVRGS